MKKKGFTLIELLAVIVILAIIALIATPIILNMINSAKKSSARSAALGYIDAIEYNNGFAEVEQPGYTLVTGSNIDVSNINVKLKGKKPSSGTVTVNSKGKVESAKDLCFNGYAVDYDGKDATVKGKCSGSTPTSNFGGTIDKSKQYSSSNVEQLGLKGVAYLDPTNLEATCDKESSDSTTGKKTGCMKFYIFSDDGNKYKMILDHNTTAQTPYNSTKPYVEYNNSTIKGQVDADTDNWQGTTRIIKAEEIASITNTTNFDTYVNPFYLDGIGTSKQTKASSSQGSSPYAWLYDYTNGCTNSGCSIADSNAHGYWTSTQYNNSSDYVWRMFNDGRLDNYGLNNTYGCGLRPVLEIEKNKLS